jgi:hypothetical protein
MEQQEIVDHREGEKGGVEKINAEQPPAPVPAEGACQVKGEGPDQMQQMAQASPHGAKGLL